MRREKRPQTGTAWIILAGLTVVLAATSVTGCEGGGATVTPVEVTQEPEHIRLPMGFIPNIQFAPFYVAVERGYFAQAGIELEFDYGFETQGVQLVAAGELPFAVASGDQVILARSQGLPVVYITEWWQRFPVAVVSLAEQGIQTPADLAGHSLGVPELFGASYIGWQALLSATSLPAASVTLETIGYSQVPSLVEGRVEAAVVYANNEPVLLAKEGHAINVIEVADYADIASNGLITSDKVIAERPELARRFVYAFLRGLSDTLADPEAAFEISTGYVEGLAENAAFGKAVLYATLPYWQADRLGYSEATTWEQSQQAMQDAGLLETPSPVDSLFTNQFLPDGQGLAAPMTASKGTPSLRVEGVWVSYPTPEGELTALKEVSLAVMPGEFVCLVGPSGCGKTTLLRTLAGLLAPSRGRVWLDGEPVTAPRRQVGLVFQKANLMPWRTVLGNVLLPLELSDMLQAKAVWRARVLIELVGLGEFANAYPADLSGGMAQRVAIARALAHDPEFLLLDEPFGSLDALTRERMGQELLRIWHAQRNTVLMVTHSVTEAVFLADRVIVLSPRPGTVAAMVVVDLPRPRDLGLMETSTFGALAGKVRAAIKEG